jgi:hypothetical protein
MAQVVEHLPSKFEALSPTSVPSKKKQTTGIQCTGQISSPLISIFTPSHLGVGLTSGTNVSALRNRIWCLPFPPLFLFIWVHLFCFFQSVEVLEEG